MFEQLQNYKGNSIIVELANGKQLAGTVVAVDQQNLRLETAEGACVVRVSSILVLWEKRSLTEENMKFIAHKLGSASGNKPADTGQPCSQAYTQPCVQAYAQPCYYGFGPHAQFMDPCFERFGHPRFERFGQPCFERFGHPCFGQFVHPCFERFGHPCFERFGHPCFERFGHPCFERFGHPCFGKFQPCFFPFGPKEGSQDSGQYTGTQATGGASGQIPEEDKAENDKNAKE